jgi:hypothetical protein
LTADFFVVVYDVDMLKRFREQDIKLSRQAIQSFRFYSSILVIALVAFFFAVVYWHLLEPRKDFFNELWAPAYLLIHGKSPYNTSVFNPISPAAWLPMAIGFFSPFGWLGDDIAYHAWFGLSILELCFMIFVVQGKSSPLYITTITGLMVFSFPPTLYHFILGQFSITSMLCLIMAVHFVKREYHWTASFFVALALTKPHLATLALLGLSYHYFQHGQSRAMLLFWARVSTMVFVLCAPLFIGYPNWIPDAITSMKANPYWSYPTLFILFQRYFGIWGTIVWIAIVPFIIWLSFLLWRRFTPIPAIYWSLGMAPLISPYLGSWDFVVVLPALIFTFFQTDWKRRIFLIMSYLLAWYGMALIQGLEESHNHFFWWVPVWFMISVAIATNWKTGELSHDIHQFTE